MEITWKNPEHVQIKENKGVTYLAYDNLSKIPDIVHGFSTRLGGTSQGIYSSMNLSFTRGDNPDAVFENYRRMAIALEVPMESFVTSDQTHTTNVRVVTKADCGNGVTKPRPYTNVDGMVTNEPGVTLATFYADCVPLYFVDPVHKAVGLSHSGWKGTVGKMGKVTVETMTREYGTDPEDVIAAIGPSICQECYEVSEDVAKAFAEILPAELILKEGRTHEDGKHYQLDLWEANYLILLEAGVKANHIAKPGICTCCNPKLLFSHRASKGKRGNLGAFLGIRE